MSAVESIVVFLGYFATAGKSLTEADLKKAAAEVFPKEADRIVDAMAEQWRQQGWRDSTLSGIRLALDIKFGADGLRLLPEIRKIKDMSQLKAVQVVVRTARTPDEVRHALRQ